MNKTLAERFWPKVNIVADDCWEWQGYVNPNGYGQLHHEGVTINVHRVSWILHNGDIPIGMSICHTCDNRSCVNPSHLWVGDACDNALDRDAKGRGVTPYKRIVG